ncbi:MAG: NADH-quinone oxidoreductase subunit F, partial [Clostridiales bacterium]|nr:NADH-quinone oxidoreductase subunit F [Clostridiales bacterium]
MTLQERKEAFKANLSQYKARIMICAGTGCVANGSLKVYDEFVNRIKDSGLSVSVAVELKEEKEDYVMAKSGCQGFCQMGPLVTIYPQGILYIKVKPEDVEEIVEKTILNGETVDRLLYLSPETGKHIEKADDIPFYARQHRLGIKHCGHIDALDMEEYIANDGYAMAEKAFTQMTGEEICKRMVDSGLRGRGGGGFPTGRKWELTRIQPDPIKYIICNGDEGDPGAFMDRCLLEACPHSVLEGMLVAARAVGATEGYIYVRTEYPLAVERLKVAVEDARRSGFLGKDIFGSGIDFDIHIMEGAGAFVCGEETALIASIEGKRGMPSPKPPFP